MQQQLLVIMAHNGTLRANNVQINVPDSETVSMQMSSNNMATRYDVDGCAMNRIFYYGTRGESNGWASGVSI